VIIEVSTGSLHCTPDLDALKSVGGERSGLQKLHSRVRFPPGAPLRNAL
jgi:hypothetical protein